jgi:hypothetical protein
MNVLPTAMANGRNHIGTIAGKLNGAIAADDPERLADDVAVDAGRDVLEAEALHQRGRAAGHLDALDAAADAAARFVERLAMLGRHRARELLEMLLAQLLELVEHLDAGVHRRVAPARKRLSRRRHCGVDVTAGRERGPADDVTDRRIVDVEKIGRAGFHPAAADEVVERENVRTFCDGHRVAPWRKKPLYGALLPGRGIRRRSS